MPSMPSAPWVASPAPTSSVCSAGAPSPAAGVIASGWGMAVPEAMARLRAAAYAEGRLVVDIARDVLRGNTTMER